MIDVQHLSKQFGETSAVSDVSFVVHTGKSPNVVAQSFLAKLWRK